MIEHLDHRILGQRLAGLKGGDTGPQSPGAHIAQGAVVPGIGSGGLKNHHRVVLLEGGGAVIADAVLIPGVVLQEVPQHGSLRSQAVVGAVQTVGVLHDGDSGLVAPGVGLKAVIGAGDALRRLGNRHAQLGYLAIGVIDRGLILEAVDCQEVLGPQVGTVPAVVEGSTGIVRAVALSVDQVGGDGIAGLRVGVVLIERGGGHRGIVVRGLLRKLLGLHRAHGLAGAVHPGEVKLKLTGGLPGPEQGHHGLIAGVHVLGADRHRGVIGLVGKDQRDAVLVGGLPPAGGVEENDVGLAAARPHSDDGGAVGLKLSGAVRQVEQDLPQLAIDLHHRADHGTGLTIGGLDCLLGVPIGGLVTGHDHIAVIHPAHQSIAVGRGVVITGVVGEELIDLLGRQAVPGHGHLGDGAGILRLPGRGVLRLGVDRAIDGIGGPRLHTVVGLLPVLDTVIPAVIASEQGGNRNLSPQDHALSPGGQAVPHILGDVIAIGSHRVLLGANGVQIGAAGALAVQIGLGDHKDRILSCPGLQGGTALAVADEVPLAEGRPVVHIFLRIGGVGRVSGGGIQPAHGPGQEGQLLLRRAPALRAAGEHKQALTGALRQVEPTVFRQELGGVRSVRQGDHIEVGTARGVLRQIDVHLPAGLSASGVLIRQRFGKIARHGQLVGIAVIIGGGALAV